MAVSPPGLKNLLDNMKKKVQKKISAGMKLSIMNSPKGKLPPGLAKYLAMKKKGKK
jgi:hypothetical protein